MWVEGVLRTLSACIKALASIPRSWCRFIHKIVWRLWHGGIVLPAPLLLEIFKNERCLCGSMLTTQIGTPEIVLLDIGVYAACFCLDEAEKVFGSSEEIYVDLA